jgi:fatty acid desaturase
MSLVPQPHDLLASDTERERVAEALRAHAAAGRLEAEELEQRLERAFSARTRADLVPLVADLPAPSPRPRRELPNVPPVIPIAVLLIAIWALAGAGYFWPMWPIGAMLIGTFKHSSRRPAMTRRRLAG